MRAVTLAGAAVLLVVALAAGGLVVNPASGDQLSPVPFDQTLTTGLSGVDVEQARAAGHVVPRGEVFYAQYEYVVGYYGLGSLADGVTDPRYTRQFGQPLAVFVTDLAEAEPSLTENGRLTCADGCPAAWTRAEDAWFVVGTPARTPAGPTAVPFGDRSAARAFATEHDGDLLDWAELQRHHQRETDSRDRQPPTAARHRWADETVQQARETRDRPVSTVVGTDPEAVAAAVERTAGARDPTGVVLGEDASSLAAVVEAAPANTTVRLLPGRYDATLGVSKPLTLTGAGPETVLDGGGNGSVLTVRSPDVAVTDLRIEGVGDATTGQNAADDGSAWDERIRLAYGYGDAGVRLRGANRSLVENVTIHTPANGIVALDSDDAVVRAVDVRGTNGTAGFMGVLPMYSRMVVEESRFEGGRDAVYTHYADGTVVRDNHVQDLRYGVHEMYTSDTLVANNTVRDTEAGVVLMTRPTANALVGNDVRDSGVGIETAGTAAYTVDNTLVDNEVGLSIGASRSVYRANTIADNHVGVRSKTLLSTNDVSENDVVGNDRPVSAGAGTLATWAVEGRGNYWGTVPGLDRDGDGVVDRAYRPTNGVDRTAATSPASHALSRSPAARALRTFQATAPGLRGSGVLDPSPLAEPVHPDRIDTRNETAAATTSP